MHIIIATLLSLDAATVSWLTPLPRYVMLLPARVALVRR